MRAVRVAAGLICIGFAACFFPDLGALSGNDAGPDGASDATANDAAVNDAAMNDASADAGPCAAQHVFCDDFDDGPLGAKWDSPYLTDGGALGLTTVHAVTAPSALAATAAQTGPSVEGEAELQKLLPAADHTRVQADVTVAAGASVSELDMIALIPKPPPPGSDYADFDIQLGKTTGYLEQYVHDTDGGESSQDLAVDASFAATRHVVLDVDFPSQTYALAIDGVPIQTMTLNPPMPKSPLELDVGIAYIESSQGTWTVFVDDVVVDQW
ncbi:MAG TPA: hypothetical protein VGH28_00265 [Polyangiaceae bacterium]|jgi:hypothetical protein